MANSNYPTYTEVANLPIVESVTSLDRLFIFTREGRTSTLEVKNLIIGLSNVSFAKLFTDLRSDVTALQTLTATHTTGINTHTGQITSLTSTVGQLDVAGAVIAVAGAVPGGWLECDGRAVSRLQYGRLFTAIGTIYGSGDGTTTFNLPDLRGRVIVQEDKGAERLTGAAVGVAGGEQTHTLTQAEVPTHNHKLATNQITGNNPANYIRTADDTVAQTADSHNSASSYSLQRDVANKEPTLGRTSNVGGDGSHNNLQPYLTMRYIIRY